MTPPGPQRPTPPRTTPPRAASPRAAEPRARIAGTRERARAPITPLRAPSTAAPASRTAARTAARTTTRTATRPAATARAADRPKTLHPRPASKPRPRAAVPKRRARKAVAITLSAQRRRLHGARTIVLLLLVILVGRLVQLQGFESTKYAKEGQDRRLRPSTLVAQRGAILDRNGAELAISQDARMITADPKLVKDAAASAAALAPLLHVPAAEIEAKLTSASQYVVLARDLDVPVARDVMALKLAGISYERSTKRIYPNGSLAASVVGLIGELDPKTGKPITGVGIERQYDDVLRGRDGKMVVEVARRGVISSGIRQVTDPQPGQNVELTIDRDIQWMAQRTLESEVARTGSVGGHIIVLNVKTGEILAIASAPTFDPNNLAAADPKTLGGIAAISNVYEPGSVNKLPTMAAAIETGLDTPDSEVVVPPSIRIADKTFAEHGASTVQHLTLRGVLAMSSNVGTIVTAQKLGKQTVFDYLRKFGLGEKTGVGISGESKGLLAPPAQWSGSQVGNIPIGQGVSATALQMAQMYAIVANGGIKVTPTLIKGTISADGTLVPAAEPTRTRVITESTAAQLREMLEAVTSAHGTAPGARIPGYRVAGKTGTARRVRDDGGVGYDGSHISSFIGFAPAEAPELLVEVVLDKPLGSYYAGTVATPGFVDVMSFALAARKVAPSEGTVPEPRLTTDGK